MRFSHDLRRRRLVQKDMILSLNKPWGSRNGNRLKVRASQNKQTAQCLIDCWLQVVEDGCFVRYQAFTGLRRRRLRRVHHEDESVYIEITKDLVNSSQVGKNFGLVERVGIARMKVRSLRCFLVPMRPCTLAASHFYLE
jgi:hypothetical protein